MRLNWSMRVTTCRIVFAYKAICSVSCARSAPKNKISAFENAPVAKLATSPGVVDSGHVFTWNAVPLRCPTYARFFLSRITETFCVMP
jgi:hypothetical protein